MGNLRYLVVEQLWPEITWMVGEVSNKTCESDNGGL